MYMHIHIKLNIGIIITTYVCDMLGWYAAYPFLVTFKMFWINPVKRWILTCWWIINWWILTHFQLIKQLDTMLSYDVFYEIFSRMLAPRWIEEWLHNLQYFQPLLRKLLFTFTPLTQSISKLSQAKTKCSNWFKILYWKLFNCICVFILMCFEEI